VSTTEQQDDDYEATYTWITKDDTVDSGGEVEFFIAVHAGDVKSTEYDWVTGAYRYRKRQA
jgi:hypothetical protein